MTISIIIITDGFVTFSKYLVWSVKLYLYTWNWTKPDISHAMKVETAATFYLMHLMLYTSAQKIFKKINSLVAAVCRKEVSQLSLTLTVETVACYLIRHHSN